MAEWNAIRRIARAQREALEQRLSSVPALDSLFGTAGNPIPRLRPAEELLAAALEEIGFGSVPLLPGDELLAGAEAVLDREACTVWYDDSLPPDKTRFNIAHELGHWWLETDLQETGVTPNVRTACSADALNEEFITDPLPFGQELVSGYSPIERNEIEKNVFAAEFLLPCPALRHAFGIGKTAAQIAAYVGISPSLVRGQMAEALLMPEPPQEPSAPVSAPTMSSPLPGLDESQRRAAEVERGPVLIAAGPGTGKTRTLVARVLCLLERGTPPEQILALTFSNKAANEMRERLAQHAPEAARRLWIGTFHAFGRELLSRYGTRLGLPPAPVLLDPLDAITLLEKNLARLPLREYEYLHNPTYPFRDLLAAFSRAKDELKTPAEYANCAALMRQRAEHDPFPNEKEREQARRAAAKAEEAAAIYAVWQTILQEQGTLDFGDLLARSVELLTAFPEVRDEVQRQYPQVLVDEFQDINRASAVLVKCVAGDGKGLWAVGDLRQSIYRFRGASAQNLTAFEADYPGARRLSLDVNYRSRPPLVRLFAETANQMSTKGHRLDWQPRRTEDTGAIPAFLYAEAENESAQADGIAEAIRRFVAQGIPLSEQAILVRAHAQAEALAAKMEERGVPAFYLGDLLDRPEIKDMLSLLSFACEPHSSGWWRFHSAEAEERMKNRSEDDADPSAGVVAPDTLPLLDTAKGLAYHGDAYRFLSDLLFESSDYVRDLLREETLQNRQKRLALYQLLRLARGFSRRPLPPDAVPQRAFLDFVRHLAATGEDTRIRLPSGADNVPAVRLMTVHSAKGLEFPVVFVPNMAQELFPTRRQGEQVPLPDGMVPLEENPDDEEECLFFVALSRARDYLLVSRPCTVKQKPKNPSPLLALLSNAPGMTADARVEWRDAAADAAKVIANRAETPDAPGSLPPAAGTPLEATLSEVEQYRRCPRQFYYRRVLNLTGHESDSAWNSYQRSLWHLLRWVEEEKQNGHRPDDAEITARLDAVWQERMPLDHPHASLFRERAAAILARAFETEFALPPTVAQETLELKVTLPSGSIRFRPDTLTTEPGRIIVERVTTGTPGDKDHTDERNALYRQAARQQQGGALSGSASSKIPTPDVLPEVEVRLRYLTTGEVRIIPAAPRYEPARLDKYEQALRGMASKSYPAQPENAVTQCPHCAFFFFCPS